MVSHQWFIEELEKVKSTFDDDTYPLPGYQSHAFEVCCELLREDMISLAKRSKQRRSVRSRVRSLLVDVFTGLGGEVFLLCTLATNVSTLATVPIKSLIRVLRQWWNAVSHPKGLTENANQVCEASSIRTLICPQLKRHVSEVDDTEQASPPTRRTRLESHSPGFIVQQHQDTIPDLEDIQPAQSLQPQFTNRTIEKGLTQTETTHSQSVQILPDSPSNSHSGAQILDRPVNQPENAVLYFKYTDLLNFLQQYQASCPNLKMICPYGGVPLPTIKIPLDQSLQLSTTVELSLRASERFMKYIASTTVKISQ